MKEVFEFIQIVGEYTLKNYHNVIQLFSMVLLLLFFIWLLHHYAHMSYAVPLFTVGAAITTAFKISQIYEEYKVFVKHKQFLSDRANLTEYGDDIPKLLKKYKVFKKSDFHVNQYYWKIKTQDCKYYYTNSSNAQSEKETLKRILQVTKISQEFLFQHRQSWPYHP